MIWAFSKKKPSRNKLSPWSYLVCVPFRGGGGVYDGGWTRRHQSRRLTHRLSGRWRHRRLPFGQDVLIPGLPFLTTAAAAIRGHRLVIFAGLLDVLPGYWLYHGHLPGKRSVGWTPIVVSGLWPWSLGQGQVGFVLGDRCNTEVFQVLSLTQFLFALSQLTFARQNDWQMANWWCPHL